ncbi:c-type cytochrome [Rhodobacter capsulatus]|uniref:c-type cytochrome n=1 Tax=Rhodobacter capsulatus TaxID=1061 RepID=UPI0040264372
MLVKTHITKIGVTLFAVALFYGFIYMLSNSLFATRPATAVAVDASGKALLPSVDEAAMQSATAPAAAAPAPAAEAAAEPAEPAAPPPPAYVEVDAALITGDAKAGETYFGKTCKACHKIDGKNAIGPHLNGVIGRATATVEGFKYSKAMKAHVGNWTPERLDIYLVSPKAEVPGTKMSFAGIPDAADRANVIAYLYSLPR